MPCDHVGGPEVIEMAEQHLRESAIPEPQWDGARFRYAENLEGQMWASIVIEVERRGEAWVITRLDRNKTPVESTGLMRL